MPAGPPITLQCAPPMKALHDAGSARPNVVHLPLPPSTTEQSDGAVKAEQRLAGAAVLYCVEQKLFEVAPTLKIEHWLPAPAAPPVVVLHSEPPALFVEHR